MSEINANIVVEPITLDVTQTPITQTVTVAPIDLSIFTNQSLSSPAGTNGQLQFKVSDTTFGGLANSNVASGTLTFSNLANLKIEGGVNAYYLQTDGTGTLTWAAGGTPTGSGVPSGANTQIQLSDGSGTFDSGVGFTFDKVTNIFSAPGQAIIAGNVDSTAGIFNGDAGGLSNVIGANVIGTVATATSATTAGTVTVGPQPNITSTGTLTGLTIAGGNLVVTGAVINGDGGGISNINAANITGFSTSSISNGTSNVDIATVDGNIDFTVGSANVARMSTTGAAYPGVLAVNGNITAKNDIEVESGAVFVGDGGSISNVQASNVTGSFTSLTVAGTSSIQQTIEDVDLITAQTSPYNFPFNTAIRYTTTDASNNLTINFQGPSGTLDAMLSTGESIVGTYAMKTGATPYAVTAVNIDTVSQTIKWTSGASPTGVANSCTAYVFTIIKTASSTFEVLGSYTSYS